MERFAVGLRNSWRPLNPCLILPYRKYCWSRIRIPIWCKGNPATRPSRWQTLAFPGASQTSGVTSPRPAWLMEGCWWPTESLDTRRMKIRTSCPLWEIFPSRFPRASCWVFAGMWQVGKPHWFWAFWSRWVAAPAIPPPRHYTRSKHEDHHVVAFVFLDAHPPGLRLGQWDLCVRFPAGVDLPRNRSRKHPDGEPSGREHVNAHSDKQMTTNDWPE